MYPRDHENGKWLHIRSMFVCYKCFGIKERREIGVLFIENAWVIDTLDSKIYVTRLAESFLGNKAVVF